MYLDQFFASVETCLESIRTTQRDAIERAGEMVAESLAGKGAWAVMDTGHLLQHECRMRAGGLLALTPFSFELKLEEEVLHRENAQTPEELAQLEQAIVRVAFRQSKLKAGDVLLINSNSGRTSNVIEAALQAREQGITTIGLASSVQMAQCAAAHPTGKKLDEVVDIFISNESPLGDAAVAIAEGRTMCPLSGISSAYVLWAIQAQAVGLLEARGLYPTIYRSVHTTSMGEVEATRGAFSRSGF